MSLIALCLRIVNHTILVELQLGWVDSACGESPWLSQCWLEYGFRWIRWNAKVKEHCSVHAVFLDTGLLVLYSVGFMCMVNIDSLYYEATGAVLENNIWRHCPLKWRRRRCRVVSVEGGRIETPNGVRYREGFPLDPQPNRGSQGASWDSSGVWAGNRPETHFDVVRRPQNAPYCAYTLMLWFRQCLMSHWGYKAVVEEGWGQLPLPQRRTAPWEQRRRESSRERDV